MATDFAALAAIVDGVVGRITPATDTTYSRYNTPEEMLADLHAIRTRLVAGDASALRLLRTLFAPTGAIQDVAADNGWGAEYLEMAELLDALVASEDAHP